MHITNTANGRSAYGLVRDECPGCGAYDIGKHRSSSALRRRVIWMNVPLIRTSSYSDMSPSLFEELGSLDTGVLKVSWHYENKDFEP